MKQAIMLVAAFVVAVATGPAFARDANKTLYPIVFAHGMAGFDNILGYDYWGDDYGVFVLDTCQWGESTERDIDSNQKSFVGSVTPFQSSEQRGYELYQDILGYMASSGAQYVNIVGHSQGGLDLRKAAKSLYTAKGRKVVKYGISISSPHRGSPIAKHVWNLGPGVQSVIATLAEFYGDIVYGSGNDAYAALKQLIHDDISAPTASPPAPRRSTPPTRRARPTSRVRAASSPRNRVLDEPGAVHRQRGLLQPGCDGYATTDADNDGALGIGNGNRNDTDDDGLVGLNSQQMGYRLEYLGVLGLLDYVYEKTNTGNVTDLNAPPSIAMTSKSWVINQDHLDVVGVPPDTFDEMEFYAAITDYIADGGF